MKVFLDANIIVAFLIRQEPLYKSITRIISTTPTRFQLYTSSVGLAIGFYYAAKKYGRQKVKKNIALLVEHLTITDCGAMETKEALMTKALKILKMGWNIMLP